MKFLLTIQKENPITDNEYPYNHRGFETVIENRIGGECWAQYITQDMVVLNIFPLTGEQEKYLPYSDL